jgi:hypothetical protein
MCHEVIAVKRETPNQPGDKTAKHRNLIVEAVFAATISCVLSITVMRDNTTITIKNNQSGGGISE